MQVFNATIVTKVSAAAKLCRIGNADNGANNWADNGNDTRHMQHSVEINRRVRPQRRGASPAGTTHNSQARY